MPQLEHLCGLKPYKTAETPHINTVTVPLPTPHPPKVAKFIRDCSFRTNQSPRCAKLHGKLVLLVSLLQNCLFS